MLRLLALLISGVSTVALCGVVAPEEPARSEPASARSMFQRFAGSVEGAIELPELSDAVPEFVRSLVARAEANIDGAVTAAEFLALIRSMQSQRQERQRAAEAVPEERQRAERDREARRRRPEEAAPRRPAAPSRPEARPREPRRPEPRDPWRDPEALFRRFDRDGDGQLSLREFTAALRALEQMARPREAPAARRDPRRAPGPPGPWAGPRGRRPSGPPMPRGPRPDVRGPRAPWMQPPRREAAPRRDGQPDEDVRQALRELAAERRAEFAERVEAIRQRRREAEREAVRSEDIGNRSSKDISNTSMNYAHRRIERRLDQERKGWRAH